MALYVTNTYRLKENTPASVLEKYRAALCEFVNFVRENQPGTWVYTVLEDADEQPHTFLHYAVYEDAAARADHTSENEHKKVKEIIEDYLVDPPGFVPVEYTLIASQTVFSKSHGGHNS